MTQLQLRQFPRLLVERLRGKRFSRSRRSLDPRQLERAHIELSHVAPDHLTAQLVSILANSMPAGVTAQTTKQRPGCGPGVRDTHPTALVVRQQIRDRPGPAVRQHY